MTMTTTTMTTATADTRSTTWDFIGLDVTECDNLNEVMDFADLDFEVEKKELRYVNHKYDGETTMLEVPDFYSTVRNDGKVYGVVSTKYEIVQNRDAFDFLNYVPDLSFYRAGETASGVSYLVGKLPTQLVLGEEYSPSVILRNSFDGFCGVQAILVPVRLFCKNQFNVFFRNYPNILSVRHSHSANAKLKDAEHLVDMTSNYFLTLNSLANKYAVEKVSNSELKMMVNNLFPMPKQPSDRQKKNVYEKRKAFLKAYHSDDNANFYGTVWGVINAYTDYTTHAEPLRKSKNFEEQRFLKTTSNAVNLNKILTIA